MGSGAHAQIEDQGSTTHSARNTGNHDGLSACSCRSYTQDQARGRNDTVVGAEDGSTQPARPMCSMSFAVSHIGR